MPTIKGLLFVKHGAVGTRSEGPVYYVQTKEKDIVLECNERHAWDPDYYLEFFSRQMVEVEGEFARPDVMKATTVKVIVTAHIP